MATRPSWSSLRHLADAGFFTTGPKVKTSQVAAIRSRIQAHSIEPFVHRDKRFPMAAFPMFQRSTSLVQERCQNG